MISGDPLSQNLFNFDYFFENPLSIKLKFTITVNGNSNLDSILSDHRECHNILSEIRKANFPILSDLRNIKWIKFSPKAIGMYYYSYLNCFKMNPISLKTQKSMYSVNITPAERQTLKITLNCYSTPHILNQFINQIMKPIAPLFFSKIMFNYLTNSSNTCFLYYPAIPNIIKDVESILINDCILNLQWSNMETILYQSIAIIPKDKSILKASTIQIQNYLDKWKYDDGIKWEELIQEKIV